MSKPEESHKRTTISFRKKYINPDQVRTEYSNEMTVSHSSREFFISFYRLETPTILDEDERAALLEKETIDAVMVAKLALTPDFVEAVIKTLQDNIEKYNEEKFDDQFLS